MTDNSFTLLIQGPIHRNLQTMCLLHPTMNIVVSTWEDPKVWEHPTVEQYLNFTKTDNIQISVNKLPNVEGVYNFQNRYYQFCSMCYGLEFVKTKYTIKVRSDEYYSDLEPVISMLLMDDEKMVTNDVFFRKINFLRYHPSDHIIAAKTDKLKKLFYALKQDCEINKKMNSPFYPKYQEVDRLFVEQHIGTKWVELNENEKIPAEYADVKRLMTKHFDIISNDMLGEYCVSVNSKKNCFINSNGYHNESNDIKHSMEEL